MKRVLWVLVWIPAFVWAQNGSFSPFYVGNTRVFLSMFASGEPDDMKRFPGGNYVVEGNVVHRVFVDTSGNPYFGYDLEITPDPAGRTFRVAALRPSKTFDFTDRVRDEKPRLIHVDGAKLHSFDKLPAPATLGDGDRIEIPVLENRSSGGRIIDSYAIAFRGTQIIGAPNGWWKAESAPAGTLLHLEEPALTHDGNDWGENPEFGVTGPAVWLYTPWRGRFLLSATERPGFRRAGLAEGTTIRFSDGVEAYQVNLRTNAIDRPGMWWVWVKRESEFKPDQGVWTEAELRRGMLAVGAEK